MKSKLSISTLILVMASLYGCGDAPKQATQEQSNEMQMQTFSITVKALHENEIMNPAMPPQHVFLSLNGQTYSIELFKTFTFPVALNAGDPYNVQLTLQDFAFSLPGENGSVDFIKICKVFNGQGTIQHDVNDIELDCIIEQIE